MNPKIDFKGISTQCHVSVGTAFLPDMPCIYCAFWLGASWCRVNYTEPKSKMKHQDPRSDTLQITLKQERTELRISQVASSDVGSRFSFCFLRVKHSGLMSNGLNHNCLHSRWNMVQSTLFSFIYLRSKDLYVVTKATTHCWNCELCHFGGRKTSL